MLWYCEFTWHPGTSPRQVRERVVQQHDVNGSKIKQHLRGWYNLAGGGAGFLMLDVPDGAQLTELLTPYMDLLSFDVRAVYELPYDETIQRLKSSS